VSNRNTVGGASEPTYDYVERGTVERLTAALAESTAQRDAAQKAVSEAAHYLSEALKDNLITCYCWGASGCDAHEMLEDLMIAAAPAQHGGAGDE